MKPVLVVGILLLASLVLIGGFVATSPSMSPFDAFRDSDGDGHADANDAAPQDAMRWASGTSKVLVTVHNQNASHIDYEVLVNGIMELSGSLDAYQGRVDTIQVNFTYGDSISEQAEFTGLCVSDGDILSSDQETLTLIDGGSYAVTLNL